MGWKGKGNGIWLSFTSPYVITGPFQPVSSSMLPYKRYMQCKLQYTMEVYIYMHVCAYAVVSVYICVCM